MQRLSAIKRIFRDFRGANLTGKTYRCFTPIGVPKNLALLGWLDYIELFSGQRLVFATNPSLLGAAEVDGRRRMFIGLKRPYAIPKTFKPGRAYNYGEIDQIGYHTTKPHLYRTTRVLDFYHEMGEEGGRRPQLIFCDGVLSLRGGDYEIRREGIRN
jgi:hypothetical protein